MSKISLSIDFTPNNTAIYRDGKGVVLDEPNVVLCQGGYQDVEILGFGSAAQKTQHDQFYIYPVGVNGVDASEMLYARQMVAEYVRRVTMDKPNANIVANFAVSCGVTPQFKKSIRDLAYYAGISEVSFVPYPIADMVGCGITFDDFLCCMIIDINTANTDVAILSEQGIASALTLNVGTKNFEQAIFEQVKFRYGISLNNETLDEILGHLAVLSQGNPFELSYSGVDIRTGRLRSAKIRSDDICEAIKGYYVAIAETVENLYCQQTPLTRQNLGIQGAVFCGRGSLIAGLSEFMSNKISMPVLVANYECTLYGLGRIAKSKTLYKKLMKNVE